MQDDVFAPPATVDLGEPLRSFMVKGVRYEGPVRSGLHWVTARRGRVTFHERGLSCWDWRVPYADVTSARIEWYRGTFVRSPVLLIRTRDEISYQFGLNPGSFWSAPDLPLAIEVTDVVHGTGVRRLVRLLVFFLVLSLLLYRLAT